MTFVVLAFALSYAVYLAVIASHRGWIGVAVPPSLAGLGVVGPGIAALLLAASRGGSTGVRHLVGGLGRWRIGRRWWVATLLVPLGLIGATYAAYLALGGTVETSSTIEQLEAAGSMAVVVLPALALVTVALALGEEVGWRGYLLPLLQARFSALEASLLLGAVWFAWHVPLAFLPGASYDAFPAWLWATSIVASAVVYTWLFNNTGGSLLAVTLYHGGVNVWGSLVALHPSETGEVRSAVVIAGAQVLLATVLVVWFGAATLTRSDRPAPAGDPLDVE